MNDQTLGAIVEELRLALVGRRMGKVFQLARARLVIDFRSNDSGYLLISAEASQPRLYLVRRTIRELEKQSLPPAPFASALRKHVGGATLRALTKDEGDRIVRFAFDAPTTAGDTHARSLVAQLTGRTANLFLLDEHERILDYLRQPHGKHQAIADLYEAPPVPATRSSSAESSELLFSRGEFASLSERADAHYQRIESVGVFDQRAATLQSRLRKEIEKRRKLERNFADDLARHGDAEAHKRTATQEAPNSTSSSSRL